jgi:lysyl-tRNA synthetase class I
MTPSIQNLRAFYYLLEAEQMPENAPDEWFLPKEESVRSEEQVQSFVTQTLNLLENLTTLETEEDIQSLFYSTAKAAFGEEKSSIRDYFKMLYLLILQKENGPRWGQFVLMFGRDEFIERLTSRLYAPMSF